MSSNAQVLKVDEKPAGRIDALDGMRALAMLMVFWFHAWEFSGRPSLPLQFFGYTFDFAHHLRENTRVDFFVVLSGFCLFLPIAKRPERAGAFDAVAFYWQRVRRIVPAYYAALAFAALLPAVLVIATRALGIPARWQELPSLWDLVSHLLFIHTLFPSTWDSVNGSLWTMGLEAQFYLVFPVLVWGLHKWGRRFAVGVILASFVYRIAASLLTAEADWTTQFLFTAFFMGRIAQFLFGVAVAWHVCRLHRTGVVLGGWAGAALVALGCMAYALAVMPLPGFLAMFPLRNTLLGVAFSLMIAGVVSSRTPLRKVFENRVIAFLGTISYSLFLLHQPTAWYLSEFAHKYLHLDGAWRFAFLITAGFGVVALIAYPFFLLFEKPFMRRKSSGSQQELKIPVEACGVPFPVSGAPLTPRAEAFHSSTQ